MVLVSLLAISTAVQVAQAPTAQAATVSVSPTTAEPGDAVQISGAGYDPAVLVRLCLDNERCADMGTTTAGLDGSFSTSGTIPADIAPGAHTINACQQGALGWVCASGSVEVTPPPTTTTTVTTQPTTTTTTRPTTTTTQTRPTTTRPPRSTTTPPTVTTAPSRSTPTTSGVTDPTGDMSTTTSEAVAESTTTTSPEFEAVVSGPGSTPPPTAGSPTPVVSGEATGVAVTDTSGGGLFGQELHDWVLMVVAPALGLTVIWLVDYFGGRSRRSRHLFLASVRPWRR